MVNRLRYRLVSVRNDGRLIPAGLVAAMGIVQSPGKTRAPGASFLASNNRIGNLRGSSPLVLTLGLVRSRSLNLFEGYRPGRAGVLSEAISIAFISRRVVDQLLTSIAARSHSRAVATRSHRSRQAELNERAAQAERI